MSPSYMFSFLSLPLISVPPSIFRSLLPHSLLPVSLSLSCEGEEEVNREAAMAALQQKTASRREMYIEQFGGPEQWEEECSYVPPLHGSRFLSPSSLPLFFRPSGPSLLLSLK